MDKPVREMNLEELAEILQDAGCPTKVDLNSLKKSIEEKKAAKEKDTVILKDK